MAKPYEEPVFEYSDPVEDAKLQNLLRVRDEIVAGPTAHVVDQSTPFRAAANASKADLLQVAALLRSGQEPLDHTWKSITGLTQLHYCAAIGELRRMADLLRDEECNINAINLDRQTPLHLAAFYGQVDAAHFLIANGCSRDVLDRRFDTPLDVAVQQNNVAMVRMLTDMRPDLSALGDGGLMITHKAARGKSGEIMRLLLAQGGWKDAEDDQCNTPLHYAAMGGNLEPADALLEVGAEPNVANRAGETPLMHAALNGNSAMVHLLLKHKAKPNLVVSKRKWTVLHQLCWLHQDEAAAEKVLLQLLQAGATPDARNIEDKSPLFYAVARDARKLVAALCYAGAKPTVQDCALNTPLHFVTSGECAELLCRKGGNAVAANRQGNTPLHVAYCYEAFHTANIVPVLLRYGGDTQEKNLYGHTPKEVGQYRYQVKLPPFNAYGTDVDTETGGLQLAPPCGSKLSRSSSAGQGSRGSLTGSSGSNRVAAPPLAASTVSPRQDGMQSPARASAGIVSTSAASPKEPTRRGSVARLRGLLSSAVSKVEEAADRVTETASTKGDYPSRFGT